MAVGTAQASEPASAASAPSAPQQPSAPASPSAPTNPTPAPSAPSRSDAPSAPAPASSAPHAEPPAAPADPEAERWAWLESLDPALVAQRNRKFAGHVGTVADRLTREREPVLRQTWQQEYERGLTAAQLRQLRKDDPEAFAKEDERLENEALQQQAAQQIETRGYSRAQQAVNAVLADYHQSLPPEVQATLDTKRQANGGEWNTGDFWGSRLAYLRDATEALAAHSRTHALDAELARERVKLQRELEEGYGKQDAGAAIAAEPSLDAGGGTAATSGPMTQAEYDQIRGTRSERMKNRDRIEAGVNAGLIRR